MKYEIIPTKSGLMLVLFGFIFGASISFAQHTHNEHSDSKQRIETEDLPSGLSGMKPDEYKDINMDSSKAGHKHDMEMKNDSITSEKDTSVMKDTSIVRKGVIDLRAIDKNKEGKVFQDSMHLNVISDEPGKCPLCGMKLKEVSLDNAKENLIKLGFKVKEK